MNKTKLIIGCFFCMLACCNVYGYNQNTDSIVSDTLTYPEFNYRGISRRIKPVSLTCSYDSLLSVYMEDKLQYISALGYDGIYKIKIDLSINKKGEVKKVYVYRKYKEWNKLYRIIPRIIKKIKFKPVTNKYEATKTKIQIIVKIDTYQYPSNISKKLFPLSSHSSDLLDSNSK